MIPEGKIESDGRDISCEAGFRISVDR